MFILLFVCRIEWLFITNFRKEVCQKLKIVPTAGNSYERRLPINERKNILWRELAKSGIIVEQSRFLFSA
jgi:hypothetical protein